MNVARGGTLVQDLPEHSAATAAASARSTATTTRCASTSRSLAARADRRGQPRHALAPPPGHRPRRRRAARHRLGRRGRAAGGARGPGAAVRARRPVASRGGPESRVIAALVEAARAKADMHDVAVIGGGVVGTAVTLALARRGVDTVLLRGPDRLAGAASGTNSGILHTGFDSIPGELETQLILRSAELRDEVVETLGIPVWRCGALLDDRVIEGESITDPVHYTRALAAAAQACGAEVRTGVRVTERLDTLTVNCAGLYADEVARLYGDDVVRDLPPQGRVLRLRRHRARPDPAPDPDPPHEGSAGVPDPRRHRSSPARRRSTRRTRRTGRCGPRRSPRCAPRRPSCCPAIADAEPIASWAGLRPAGRGVNYVIGAAPPTTSSTSRRSARPG